MRLAIIGYGNVGRALARLVRKQRREYPFRITGIHTLRHGTAAAPEGLPVEPEFGQRAPDIAEFFEAARADAAIELTLLERDSVSDEKQARVVIDVQHGFPVVPGQSVRIGPSTRKARFVRLGSGYYERVRTKLTR